MTCFELKTARDLYKKAEEDFVALQRSPGDSRLSFNMLVTIEHLPDWLGMRGIVKDSAVLRIVSHIANGAKHFKLSDKRHKSITKTEKERVVEEGVCEEGVFYEPLVVWLTAKEEKEIGKGKIDVTELGRLALDIWKKKI